MTATTLPSVCFKSLQILQNCVRYMAKKPMMAEHNAETFSSEDAPNVVIPCSLSALLYDLLPNIKSLLSNNQRAIKMFEVCAEVC